MGCQSSRESLPVRRQENPFDHSLLINFSKGNPNSKYITERILGKGSFGVVSLVEHRISHSKRAMKELLKSSLTHEDQSSMMREVNFLSKIDLPNIMKIFEVIESPSSYHIITEYISGGELLDLICREKKLSEKQAAKYMKDIMSAVSYCHSHNIVHRDLKPQNLMLTSSDSSGFVKVIDFGLSGFSATGKKMTSTVGTPLFMCPEMFKGPYDEKCDVWSAGVILYMMITGLVPFYAKELSQLRRLICTTQVDFSKPVWENVSSEAKDLVNKMLDKNPNKRPSAQQVLSHKWFNRYESETLSDLPISADALDNLAKFYAKDKLKRTIFTFIATNMIDDESSKDLARLFRAIDKNEDGKLSKEEIEAAYEHLGLTLNDVKSIFQDVDADNSGMIEYTEFLTACFKIKGNDNKDYLAKAFEVYDQGGDGSLSIAELKSGVPGIESTKWNEFLVQADKDHDGKINLTEFKDYLLTESAT